VKTSLTAWYARIIGGFLLVQGLTTGTLLLVDPLDKAFPGILDTTEMVLQHSALHVLTGLLALAILRWGGERDLWRFALGFGLFYTALGAGGLVTGHSPGLGLQPFDHSFHLVAGLPGLLAAWFARPGRRRELTTTAPGPLPPRST
jgi:hypothetical protein